MYVPPTLPLLNVNVVVAVFVVYLWTFAVFQLTVVAAVVFIVAGKLTQV